MKTGTASWRELIRFVQYYFSIGGLLRTFFVPWRQERYESDQDGIWKYIEQAVFYLFAVILGMIIRTVTIIAGIISLALVVILFPVFLVVPMKLSFGKLVHFGSLGREWAYPVTWELDKHGRDMRTMNEVLVVDHDRAIEQIERILSRNTQQNVLVVGSQGIGKTTRLAYLARKMYRDLSVPKLNGKRLVQLFPQEMAITEIEACIKEAMAARNVVLVIENIERFEIVGIIEPYLDEPHFQILLTTDWTAYNERYKHQDNLMRSTEIVEMYPPRDEITLAYLNDWVEAHHENKRFQSETLERIIYLTNTLMMNEAQPEKSIDILEELVTLPENPITLKEVDRLVAQKTNIPLGSLNRDEKDKLIHLEDTLKRQVIGQDPAIHAIASALKRGRVGVQDSPKPIGSFLFLGPTGVGKTYTAKMLAAYYFGGEHMMIRFDMSEFRELKSMNRFVQRLGAEVEEAPFSLVFFDEIEKAHPDILNLFLQMLDEGELHTQQGRIITFRNAIIICTSNAGSQYMMKNDTESQDLVIHHIISEGILRPEFVNRFDATVLYQSLDREDIKKVTLILLGELNDHLRKHQNLEIIITKELIDVLARKGHSPKFGVRPLARVIQDDVETHVADLLLHDPVPFNLCLYIDPHDISDR